MAQFDSILNRMLFGEKCSGKKRSMEKFQKEKPVERLTFLRDGLEGIRTPDTVVRSHVL